MPEVYSWREGQVYIYTGNGATSAVVAFAQETRIGTTRGWVNQAHLDRTYSDHLTGQRADVSIGALYTFDNTIQKIDTSATAIHMKFWHSSVNGTAGMFLYSGRIDNMEFIGTEASPYLWRLQAHFNLWSAY